MGQYRFAREQRLLTPQQFQNVFDNAIPATSAQLTLLARPNQGEHARLGITLAKKRVRLAVQRNRIKRLIRESFRQQCASLPAIDIIVIGKSGVDQLDNQALTALLGKLWNKLSHRCSA